MSIPQNLDRYIHTDALLREALIQWCMERAHIENSLDRVDGTHTFDFQRGRVAELRSLIADLKRYDQPKEK